MLDEKPLRAKRAAEIIDAACEISGMDLRDIDRNGDKGLLARTDICQISVAAASLAWLKLLEERELPARVEAGHSLGEYCAACAAGCMTPEETLELVWVRGRAMLECSRVHPGTMLALVGAEAEKVRRLLDDLGGERGVWLANHNGRSQIVVSGRKEGLEAVASSAPGIGARVIPLRVSGPFHTPLMQPAREAVEDCLEKINIRPPVSVLYSGFTGGEVEKPSEVVRCLAGGITSPVLWYDVQSGLARRGVDLQVEVGPGNVLSRLASRDHPRLRAVPAARLLEREAGRKGGFDG
jgi:[acyl-carrier-protein] S-malonyltransferase